MITQFLRRSLRAKIEELNRRIDDKIIRGLSYARLAKEHKILLHRLYDLEKYLPSKVSWIERSFGHISTFMF